LGSSLELQPDPELMKLFVGVTESPFPDKVLSPDGSALDYTCGCSNVRDRDKERSK